MVLFPYSEDTEQIWNWCFCWVLWWCISVLSSKYEECIYIYTYRL